MLALLIFPLFFFSCDYPRIILSEELTNTRAAAIGTITITTARKMLLKKALNDGVINRTRNHKILMIIIAQDYNSILSFAI